MKQSRSASSHFPQEVKQESFAGSDPGFHLSRLWSDILSKIEIAYPQDFSDPTHSADYVNGSRHS